MTYTICIDWLSFTAKEGFSDDNLLSIIAPREDRVAIAPQFGYTAGFDCETQVRFFTHSHRPEMGVHYVISGSALVLLAQRGIDSRALVSSVVSGGAKVSRLDLAKDAINEGIDLRRIGHLAEHNAYTGNAHSCSIVSGSDGGFTLYIGSRNSERFARIYDKAAQTGAAGDWIRAEIETKGHTAQTLARHLADAAVRWDNVIGQVLEASMMVDDSTYRSLVTHSASEGLPKVEKLPDTEKWIHDQVMPAVTKYLMQHPDSVAIAELYVCIGKYLNRDVR